MRTVVAKLVSHSLTKERENCSYSPSCTGRQVLLVLQNQSTHGLKCWPPLFFFFRPLCCSLAVDIEYAEQTAHCTVSGVGHKLHAGKG